MDENKINYAEFINWIPREEASAGNILVNYKGELKIIDINNYILGISGEPVAVVYASSDEMPDGIPRAISLCNMSMTNPQVGSFEKEPSLGNIIPWGKYLDILKSYEGLPQLDESYKLKSEFTYHGFISSSSIFPFIENSDKNQSRVRDLTCEKFYGFEGESLKDLFSNFGYAIPNPGSMPEYYFKGATSDIDGKANTQTIINQVGFENLIEKDFLEKIIDIKDERILLSVYPAFITCFLFNPSITKLGDWYLPAIGELGVLLSNLGEVNKTLGILEEGERALRVCADNMALEQIPEDIKQDPNWPEEGDIFYYYGYTKYGSWLWSSTQHSYDYCWTANTLSCFISSESDKENVYTDFRVRASIMF